MSSTTSEQLNIDKVDHLTLVRAGAGAGKTTELVNRVLAYAKKYLHANKEFPKLIVTTFTRKATQELRERLLLKAIELKDQELIEYVQKQHLLHISTIHGVLNIFLSRYGAMVGMPPKFQFQSSEAENIQIRKIIRQLIRNDEALDLEILLEDKKISDIIAALKEYYEVRVSFDTQLPYVSYRNLFEEIVEEDRKFFSLLLDFSSWLNSEKLSDSWQNYKVKFDILLEAYRENLSNLKPLNYSKELDYEKSKEYLEKRKQEIKLFNDIKSVVKFKNGTDDEIQSLKKSIHNFLSEKKTKYWIESHPGLKQVENVSMAFSSLAEKFYNQFIKQKIELGQISMSDLEVISLHLLKTNPVSGELFSKEWNYWFIDEFQDTSPRQVEILRQLIGGSNSFTVGDPQQSIYLFRGARSQVFFEKEELIKSKNGVILNKLQNFRSDPELLLFFNYFFQKLNPNFLPMIPKNKLELGESPGEKTNTLSEIHATYIQVDEEANSEIDSVLSVCLSLLESGIAPEKICILGRSNKELDEIAKKAFELQVPVQVHASSKFFQRREVKDAISLLKFIVNPYDNLNFLELVRSPWFRIKDSLIASFCQNYSDNFWPIARTLLKNNEIIKVLESTLKVSHSIGIGQAWVDALIQSGIFDVALIQDPSGRREVNLWKLVSNLKEEEKKSGFNYVKFIQNGLLEALSSEEASSGDAVPVQEPKRVNIMTIHASKGLQFDYVILSRMGKFNFKIKNSFFVFDESKRHFSCSVYDPVECKDQSNIISEKIFEAKKIKEIEEYDRLLYVALTRAIKGVYLIFSKPAKQSWAARMFIPNEGIQTNGEFTTNYLVNPSVSLNKLKSTIMDDFKILPKLNLEFFGGESSEHKSVSDLLEIQSGNSNREKPSNNIEPKKVDGLVADSIFKNIEYSIKKSLLGVHIHKIFEMIKYQNEKVLDHLHADQEKEAFSFLQKWEKGKILELIKTGHVEWGFTLRKKTKSIIGQIDLWAELKDEVIILDYKTGSEKYFDKALEQLNIYTWALREMNKISKTKKVMLYVVYPFEQKVIIKEAETFINMQNKVNLFFQ